jgi:hypothetical protein
MGAVRDGERPPKLGGALAHRSHADADGAVGGQANPIIVHGQHQSALTQLKSQRTMGGSGMLRHIMH